MTLTLERFLELFGDTPIQFWMCPNECSDFIKWHGDIATCQKCGKTSEGETIKALSTREPWASLIVDGHKPIENRDWRYPPRYRGPLAIHASKTYDQVGYEWIMDNLDVLGIKAHHVRQKHECELGGLIGVATLADVVTQSDNPWFFGRFGLVFTEPTRIKFRQCRGQLGLFEIDPTQIRETERKI